MCRPPACCVRQEPVHREIASRSPQFLRAGRRRPDAWATRRAMPPASIVHLPTQNPARPELLSPFPAPERAPEAWPAFRPTRRLALAWRCHWFPPQVATAGREQAPRCLLRLSKRRSEALRAQEALLQERLTGHQRPRWARLPRGWLGPSVRLDAMIATRISRRQRGWLRRRQSLCTPNRAPLCVLSLSPRQQRSAR